MNGVEMEKSVMGHNTGTTSTAGKSIKKKKSLPRLFILARKKSFKSRPSSPTQIDTDAHPLPPVRIPSGTSVRTLTPAIMSEDITTAFSGKSVLKEIDGNQRSPEYSPRDMTLDKGTPVSGNCKVYDENRDSPSYSPSMVHHLGKVLPSDTRSGSNIAQKQYHHKAQHDLFDRPSHAGDVSKSGHKKASPLGGPGLRRPYTAIQTKFPDSIQDDSQPTPLYVGSARQADEDPIVGRRSPIPDHWVRWKASYTQDSTRESIRSGLSSASSIPDSGSTEHSSIFTKMSSISDMTIDLDELQLPKNVDVDDMQAGKHGSMTVDDAIDLYSAGFEDEFDLPPEMRSPNEDEVRRRSLKIAEAMNDTIDSVMLSAPKYGPHKSRSSSIRVSGDTFRSIFPRPPSLRSPDATHDQYGFQKSSRDVSITQYGAWDIDYAPIQARRAQKWSSWMQDQGLPITDPTCFPAPSAKSQRFIRKGIPPAYRGAAWFFYAGGHTHLNAHPDLYAELVLQSQTPKLTVADRESIERDLHRTFPDNLHFKPAVPTTPTTETPLLSSLRRVLSAFAIHHPRIGYCQSLNFLAGLLLLFLPEEKAFWMLHIICTRILPGTHDLSLEGANVDLYVLMLALKESLPSIWAKVGGEVDASTTRLPPISLCTTSWFMSLFIGTLPMESVLRVWDVLFYEGSRTLFRVALAIFKLGENEIKGISDPMEIFQCVQGLPRRMLGCAALMSVACRRGGVGQGWVERKRAERKAWYASQRIVERVRKESRDVGRRESEAKDSKDRNVVGELQATKVTEVVEEMERERDKALPSSNGWRGRLAMGFGRG
ncbi:hypothetical protein MMC19_004306 [Ptychographa xylographoides]|nr:hypothetical protein [Ptychographa xylographoides]